MEERTHLPDSDGPLVAELSSAHLEEEDRQTHEHQGDDVGNQEGASTVPETQLTFCFAACFNSFYLILLLLLLRQILIR